MTGIGGTGAAARDTAERAIRNPWTAFVLAAVGIAVGLPALFASTAAGAAVFVVFLLLMGGYGLAAFFLREKFGPSYEVLDSRMVWEIHATDGSKCSFSRQNEIRFLQNEVMVLSDRVWPANADIKDFKYFPGEVVDSFIDGDNRQFIISLRESKNRGETMRVESSRSVYDSFLAPSEWVAMDVSRPTGSLTMTVVLPDGRPPTKAWGKVRSNAARHHPLVPTMRSDKRTQLERFIKRPRRGEAYYICWEW